MATETLTPLTAPAFMSDIGERLEGIAPEANERLTIPRSVYDRLPEQLRSLCNFFAEGFERDVFLTAALTVYSGILSRVIFLHRDKWYHLNLFALVTAPPSSGKGDAGIAWRLGSMIDERLRRESREAIAEWESKTKEIEAIEKRNDRKRKNDLPESVPELGPKPPFRTLSLAINSSARAFVDRLFENEGEGVLFETETLTFLNANKQDWGNALEIYLKGYQNEPVAIDRRGGESLRIGKPCFSAFLSGTPSATSRMFIKGAEDGLFSRFMHYSFDAPPVWRSHAPGEDSEAREQTLNEAAKDLDRLYGLLATRTEPLPLLLTIQQWKMIDSTYGGLMETLERSGADRLLLASVKRAALNAERIACILTILRLFESGADLQSVKRAQPTDEDVLSAISLASTYLAHAIELAKTLPVPAQAELSGTEIMVLRAISEEPEKITTQEIAATTGFHLRKVQRIMEKLRAKDLVSADSTKGPYSKSKFQQMSRVVSVVSVAFDEQDLTQTTDATDTTNDNWGEAAF